MIHWNVAVVIIPCYWKKIWLLFLGMRVTAPNLVIVILELIMQLLLSTIRLEAHVRFPDQVIGNSDSEFFVTSATTCIFCIKNWYCFYRLRIDTRFVEHYLYKRSIYFLNLKFLIRKPYMCVEPYWYLHMTYNLLRGDWIIAMITSYRYHFKWNE